MGAEHGSAEENAAGSAAGSASSAEAAVPAPAEPEAETTGAPERRPTGRWMRYARSPAGWAAGVVLAAAAVTFQDTLVDTAKTVLSLDSLPDRISPQEAIQVVEVSDVKRFGDYLSRDDRDGRLGATLGAVRELPRRTDLVDVETSEWMITLRGRASQQVRITDIVPELDGGGCAAPLTGSLIHAQGAGEDDVNALDLAIDAPSPRLTAPAEGADAKPGQPYFTGAKAKVITLDRNESESFLITATATRGYCRWHYRVHYQVNGGTAEMVIGRPGGGPFELTARLPDAAGYPYVHLDPYLCRTWLTVSGKEYQAAGEDKRTLCPAR